ncbi:MAG: hypothetical protein P8080_06250 [Gammaproteobacteria bacterium]
MSGIDAALLAFMVAVLLLLCLRPVAFAVELVDRPGGRKAHIGVVPVIGGLCMWLAAGFVLPLVSPEIPKLASFLIGSGLLVLVGSIDDRFDLPPQVRLIAQACAGLVLCLGAGLTATNLGNLLFLGDIPLGPFGLPFTVLVAIAVINAFNMLDGMDGLAGGVSLASLLVLTVTLVLFGQPGAFGLAAVMAAVVAAFLVFNFPIPFNRPVRTFMGDAGSTMLGFAVIWLGLQMSQGPGAVISPVATLYIAALPIFDLFISFGRRLSKGRSPLQADRNHFHHILRRSGFSEREIVVLMSGSALIVGALGVIMDRLGAAEPLMLILLVLMGAAQYRLQNRAWRAARRIRRLRERLSALMQSPHRRA